MGDKAHDSIEKILTQIEEFETSRKKKVASISMNKKTFETLESYFDDVAPGSWIPSDGGHWYEATVLDYPVFTNDNLRNGEIELL